ncbi:protein TPX2 [Pyrus ussuriensis x Pyrus communis]|uniref:Protein TPX2 n=1 Tax=Pyrus ussuriensis x Pyrus communis TaxID=2448454 RepID=A0A5N5FT03_9ROSA|nr:protein TPX2 [Pyrus ussuriensis x Pyrus communis]
MYLFSTPHFFDFIKDESEAESAIERSSLLAAWPFTKRWWACDWRFDSEMEDLNYAEFEVERYLLRLESHLLLLLECLKPIKIKTTGI